MSKLVRKVKHQRSSTDLSERKSLRNTIIFTAIAVILAGIPFSMGKYIEFNSPGAFDSGAYVYSAAHILDGAKLGVEEKPSAQPGTLLVNMLGVALFGFNETGSKCIQMLLQAASLILMFIAMRKLFGRVAAAIGVIIASTYLSAPLIAKFGNVKEQYMIAFMIIGICCYVMRQLDGKWFWAVIAGAAASWAPLFKQTGVSCLGALGLFIIIQPFLKHRSWKKTFEDIALMLAGAVVALVPVYTWMLANDYTAKLPYKFVWDAISRTSVTKAGGSYISKARELSDFSVQFQRVTRYYKLLILPISLAVVSVVFRLVLFAADVVKKKKQAHSSICHRFVLLFAVWWILDMAFVWISPRSYEQYYLPLNASAAMLGGYIIALYSGKLSVSILKAKWATAGILGLVVMMTMSWHIFAGITKSPHSGQTYPKRRRGYFPRIEEISQIKRSNYQYPWEMAGSFIKQRSTPDDKIYVWGWVPGIYVEAQRFSSTNSAFTSEMHVWPHERLEKEVLELVDSFSKKKPKFLVDTHKSHYPWNRPPLELWPTAGKKGVLPNDSSIIAVYEKQYRKMLAEKVNEDEAVRFELMKPFRDFVMSTYKPVMNYGPNIIFELKK